MRGWGVARAVTGLALVVGALVSDGTVAAGDAVVRTGWWSELSPAPVAPDVPKGGFHVSAGPAGPSAVAAIAFKLAAGARATTLTLVLSGASPAAKGIRACALPAGAASFEPVSNGAWADAPKYDCTLGAVPVEVHGTTATFAVDALQQGSLLAVALVPGPMDRASFEAVTGGSLTTAAADPVTPAPRQTTFPAATAAPSPVAAPTASFAAPATAFATPAIDTIAVEAVSGGAPSASPLPRVDIASVAESWRTRFGGALGFALLLTALLFYSQGRGLLGARIGR